MLEVKATPAQILVNNISQQNTPLYRSDQCFFCLSVLLGFFLAAAFPKHSPSTTFMLRSFLPHANFQISLIHLCLSLDSRLSFHIFFLQSLKKDNNIQKLRNI